MSNSTVDDELPPFALTDTGMRIISSFSLLFGLLFIGHVMREKLMVLRRIMMPASLIAGLLGLVFIQLCTLNDDVYTTVEHDWIVGWSSLPGFLINIVFATLFLGLKVPTAKEIYKTAAPQICYGWFIGFGNWAVATFLAAVLLIPVWGTNVLFGTLGPVGFTGGHGTAAGMAATYESLDFPEGGDLAVTAATFGICFGVAGGTVLLNVANMRGWTYMSWRSANPELEDLERQRESVDTDGAEVPSKDADTYAVNPEAIEDLPSVSRAAGSSSDEMDADDAVAPAHIRKTFRTFRDKAVIPVAERVSGGDITVSSDAIETLALHMCYISLTLALSYFTKRALVAIEGTSEWLTEYAFFSGFPTFPMCLLWGLVIQMLLEKYTVNSPLDNRVMQRISGICLDVLVLSAVATTNLTAVADNFAPLFVLVIVLFAFQIFCFVVIAPMMLPDYWAERALCEYGVATATTSIGLMLLRSVDPNFETKAAAAFGSKQLVTEPFLGGGIITSLAPVLIKALGNWAWFGISITAMIFFMGYWAIFLRKESKRPLFSRKFDPAYNELPGQF